MSLTDTIKEIAHKVSEGYLLFNEDVNEKIGSLYNSGEIENKEILKRICELVNQNVYLSLFHKGDVDKSNIVFNYADYSKIANDIDDMEDSMVDYDMSPSDFRMEHTASQIEMSKTASLNTGIVKESSIHVINNFNSRVDNILSNLESVKTDAIKTAEQSYIVMKDTAKKLGYNGESIDDMSKLASSYAETFNLNFEKVASAYSLIEKEIKEYGGTVVNGLTKIASQDVDYDSPFYEPIEKFAIAIDTIEAVDEMSNNIARIKV